MVNASSALMLVYKTFVYLDATFGSRYNRFNEIIKRLTSGRRERNIGMKEKIKLYYARIRNMGDLLNPLIIGGLFGFEVERHSFLTGEISAIGSGGGD